MLLTVIQGPYKKCLDICGPDLRKMNVCWNNVYRKAFKYEHVGIGNRLKEFSFCVADYILYIGLLHCIVNLEFLNGLYKTNSLVEKECFRNV